MTRYLVPVADDLGLSRGVNGGIVEAHVNGIVTSAALLVNFPALADAVSLARANPRLSIGLHVNVTIGRPVTPWVQVPTLTNLAGEFLGLAGFLARLARGVVSRTDLSIEIGAQFSRFEETGLPLDFVNGQHHIHLFNPLTELLVSRLKDRSRMLRVTHEPLAALLEPRRPLNTKRVVFALLAHHARARLNGIASNDTFLHVDSAEFRGRRRSQPGNPFIRALRHANGAVNELMCHPGHADLPLRFLDAYVDEREVELRHLCDPALVGAVENAGLALATYPQVRANDGNPSHAAGTPARLAPSGRP